MNENIANLTLVDVETRLEILTTLLAGVERATDLETLKREAQAYSRAMTFPRAPSQPMEFDPLLQPGNVGWRRDSQMRRSQMPWYRFPSPLMHDNLMSWVNAGLDEGVRYDRAILALRFNQDPKLVAECTSIVQSYILNVPDPTPTQES